MPKEDTQFKPGESGNPAGRPKGSKNKLSQAFIEALNDDFIDNGVEAIKKIRETNPVQYAKVIVAVLPKEIVFEGDVAHQANVGPETVAAVHALLSSATAK